ncbi:class F sortase [Aquipuribacter hungaricus]|uniref:Class F sortase n=1 Tax=Aquipuribacter hungaricus TaxID=545624 RepID=A0ABV7WBU7_9MICO
MTPAALRVPAIGLDEPLVRLGIQPDGSVEVPADPDEAGWLTGSAVPGRTGPAVLAGHVDSADGVAVFTRLSELGPGDAVEVDLDDGTTARFVVTGVERYDKDAFPTARVYGPAPAPVLRLVTCGGEFDRQAGAYEDNVVVYAVPAP